MEAPSSVEVFDSELVLVLVLVLLAVDVWSLFDLELGEVCNGRGTRWIVCPSLRPTTLQIWNSLLMGVFGVGVVGAVLSLYMVLSLIVIRR